MMRIGWASRDIVPERPAMLQGQMYVRIARTALDPLTVTAMAIDGGGRSAALDGAMHKAVMVSCDLAFATESLQDGVRRRAAAHCPDLPGEAIVLAATHTHTSLVFRDGFYPQPGGDVMTASECEAFLTDRIAAAVAEAWQARRPARLGRAFGHAVVGHNRRPVFADGSARMYGRADDPAFLWLEGYEDHSLDLLFAWDERGDLSGVAVAVPCPSQVDEHLEQYSADFWHELRVELRRRLGQRLRVLPLCAPAGDQSPHFILYGKQEEDMRQRRGVSERQEIALRLVAAVERALEVTRPAPADGDMPVLHRVDRVSFTPRRISRAERDWSVAERQRSLEHMRADLWWPQRLQEVVDLFDGQRQAEPVAAELHTLRLGDAVLATNPFELYVDYAMRIKARSAAAQTILSQITAGVGWYLPTARAVQGGGYGAIPAVSIVGPEGGQELVEHTLKAIAAVMAE